MGVNCLLVWLVISHRIKPKKVLVWCLYFWTHGPSGSFPAPSPSHYTTHSVVTLVDPESCRRLGDSRTSCREAWHPIPRPDQKVAKDREEPTLNKNSTIEGSFRWTGRCHRFVFDSRSYMGIRLRSFEVKRPWHGYWGCPILVTVVYNVLSRHSF